MKNTIGRNVIWSVSQAIVQSVVLFALYKHLLATIGVAKLGVWSVVLATTSATQLSDMGLTGSLTKFVATYRSRNELTGAAILVQTATLSTLALVCLFEILGYPIFGLALRHFLPVADQADALILLPYALGSLCVTAVAAPLLGTLDGCMRSDLRAAINVFASLFFLGLAFALVDGHGLIGLAVAQIMQAAMILVLSWGCVRRVLKIPRFLPFKWSRSHFKEMASYGISFQANSFLIILFEPATKLLISNLGDLSAVGYFEMAQRFVTKVRQLIIEANKVLIPVFASFGLDEKEAARSLYIKNFHLLYFVTTPLYIFLAGTSPLVSELWIGEYNTTFIAMSACLTTAWFICTLNGPSYFALLGEGRLRSITISHLITAIINVVGGLIAGHYFGALGVVCLFSIALVFGAITPLLAYHKWHAIKLREILPVRDIGAGSVGMGLAVVCSMRYLSFLGLNSKSTSWEFFYLFVILMIGIGIASTLTSRPPLNQILSKRS